MDQLPRLGKRELICLLLFTCNYVVFVRGGSLFLWVLGMGYVIFCGTPWAFHIIISNPGRAIPKALKMVPVATLLGAQHYKASTGSPLTHY